MTSGGSEARRALRTAALVLVATVVATSGCTSDPGADPTDTHPSIPEETDAGEASNDTSGGLHQNGTGDVPETNQTPIDNDEQEDGNVSEEEDEEPDRYGWCEVEEPPGAGAPPEAAPEALASGSIGELLDGRSLVLAGGDTVSRLRVNHSAETLVTDATRQRDDQIARDLEVTDEGVHVVWEDRLQRLDPHSLEALGNRSLVEGRALGHDSADRLFVASNGSLRSYDAAMDPLEEVDTNVTTYGGNPKTAHDVHIEDSSAWLLDNVAYPMYIFRVDETSAGDLEIRYRTEISGIGQHLAFQWIEPSQDRWMVVQEQGNRCGRSQTLLTVDASDGSMLHERKSWEWGRHSGDTAGTKLLAVSDRSIPWTASFHNGTIQLARIAVDDGNLSVEPELALDDASSPPGIGDAGIARDGNVLVVVVQEILYAFDLEPDDRERPQLVHRQEVDLSTQGLPIPLEIVPS